MRTVFLARLERHDAASHRVGVHAVWRLPQVAAVQSERALDRAGLLLGERSTEERLVRPRRRRPGVDRARRRGLRRAQLLREDLAAGAGTIELMKRLREAFGMSLGDAKLAVAALYAGG